MINLEVKYKGDVYSFNMKSTTGKLLDVNKIYEIFIFIRWNNHNHLYVNILSFDRHSYCDSIIYLTFHEFFKNWKIINIMRPDYKYADDEISFIKRILKEMRNEKIKEILT